MPVEKGMEYTVTLKIEPQQTAKVVGSGTLEVLATPAMVAQMELAAWKCIEPALEAGQTSVGTALCVEHLAATPLGGTVTTTATVTAVDRRRVDFELSCRDEAGEVGKGTHSRFVVEAGRFAEKAQARGKG